MQPESRPEGSSYAGIHDSTYPTQNAPGWGWQGPPASMYAPHPSHGMMWPPPGSYFPHAHAQGISEHQPPPQPIYHPHGSVPPPHPTVQSNLGAATSSTSFDPIDTSKSRPKRRRTATSKSSTATKRPRSEITEAGVGPSTQHISSASNGLHPADLAAQSIPPGFADVLSESEKPDKAVGPTGAADCFALILGTNTSKEDATNEIKQSALKLAEAHLKANPSTLRRPSREQFSRLLCIPCLIDKFEWHVWINTDGGYSRGPRQHFLKEYPHKYKSSCAQIGYNLPAQQKDGQEPNKMIDEPITTEGLAKYLAELIADQDLAFNIVQSSALRRLLCYVGQGNITATTIPERRFVRKAAADLTEKEKERIKSDMRKSPGRVSITSDLWSDHMDRSFMAVTGHYKRREGIMDTLVVDLLAFRMVDGDHSGSNLGRILFGILSEYDILDKIGTVTLDNASNNDTMMEDLERRMCEAGHAFDKDGNRVRCFPHIINLAVNAILDALGTTGDEYYNHQIRSGHVPSEATMQHLKALKDRPDLRVREIVKALRPGQRRRALNQVIKDGNERGLWKMDELQIVEVTNADGTTEEKEEEVEVIIKIKVLNLILDVKTRWSSTRDMIFRFSELYPAICDYICRNSEALGKYTFTHLEFAVLQRILAVLNIAHRAQALLSSEETPTLALALPVYEQLMSQWSNARVDYPELSFAIKAGIKKLQVYSDKARSSPIYILAMFLNPCIKYTFIDQNWPDEAKANARQVVKRFMMKYAENRDREAEAANAEHSSSGLISTHASGALGRGIGNIIARRDGGPRRSGVRGVTPPRSPLRDSAGTSMLDTTPIRRRVSFISPQSTMSPSRVAISRRENTVDTEHDLYIATELWPIENLGKDLVKYWNIQNSSPILQAISHDVLPVQASSVSSERVFSSSKNTCTLSRNKLGADTVEMLQILKYSLRNRRRRTNSRAHIAQPNNSAESDDSPNNTLEMWTRLDDYGWEHDAILDFDVDTCA